MSTVRLLIDCGNTAVKIAVARGSVLTAFQRLPAQRDSLDAALRAGDDASEALLLPGAEATTRAVRAWWAQAGRGRPLIALGDELPLPDLGQYASCGRDRIAAGLAAAARHGASMIVIDAGTATTLTAWRWSASDSTADPRQAVRFAGGLILPGADAAAKASHASARRCHASNRSARKRKRRSRAPPAPSPPPSASAMARWSPPACTACAWKPASKASSAPAARCRRSPTVP